MKFEGSHSAKDLKLAIVLSRFNENVVEKLKKGALACITDKGGNEPDVFYVPGAFEIPFFSKQVALKKQYDAIITLGCVIRGNTPHFEYVAGEAARGINQAGMETGVPVIFGILTVNTLEDALVRASAGKENKGYEAALTAIEMANLCKFRNS